MGNFDEQTWGFSTSAVRPGPTREEQSGTGHHHHKSEDTHRHPDQRRTLRQDRTEGQHQQPYYEDRRGYEPPVPAHRRVIDGSRETGIIAVQARSISSGLRCSYSESAMGPPFPGADRRIAHQRYLPPGKVKPG